MRKNLQSFVVFLLCVSCVEPFTPDIETTQLNALVIDGHIDSGGNAIVRLSRSLPPESDEHYPPQPDAVVKIESATGESIQLNESEPGVYTASNLAVDYTTNYTLRVHTPDGRDYFSDEVTISPTPTVDSVYYTFSPGGEDVEVRTSSHDTHPDATGYYLWESIETYEYHSYYFSRFMRIKGIEFPVARGKGEYIDTCWREVRMPTVLATTKRLSDNIIAGQRLTIMNKTSPKISMRYSILVRQRSISEQEYDYRIQLAKTTDQQGSIFAQIPGAVAGNLHSTTDETETVLGYFRGQELKEQRFFIDRDELPDQFQVEMPPPPNCDLEPLCPIGAVTEGPSQCVDLAILSEGKIIINAFEIENAVVFVFSNPECSDCRVQGGTTRKPDFW